MSNTNKKKIIFLITGSGIGGAEIVVKNLIFNIDHKKFLPVFVSIRPLGTIGEEIGKKYKAISLNASEKFNPLFLWKLFVVIRNEKPEILHCHLFHANLIGRIIGRISKVPFIVSTIHSDNFGGKFRYFLLKITDFLTDITVVVSEKIKEDLVKRKIITINKIKVIYNGVPENKDIINKEDIEKIKNNLKITNNYPILLSVGRLTQVKGQIYLIQALSILKDKYPDIKLLLIGDGPEKLSLVGEVNKLRLTNNVLFLGELRDISLFYKLADIFILPSLNEGFGLAVVEAMSNKLLVVASRVGGVSEIINNRVTGFMVNTADYTALYNVINKAALITETEKNLIISNAYIEFQTKFSLKKMIANYDELYK